MVATLVLSAAICLGGCPEAVGCGPACTRTARGGSNGNGPAVRESGCCGSCHPSTCGTEEGRVDCHRAQRRGPHECRRARYGLPPLEVDDRLMESARAHATWMTLNQTMQHTRQPVAENIAMGQRDSQEVVQCWMNSSGHRANILNGGHRRIGVAAYRTIQGTIFWCQQFRN